MIKRILLFIPLLSLSLQVHAIILYAVDFGTANDDEPIGVFDRLSGNLEAASTGNSIHRALIEFDTSSLVDPVSSAWLYLRRASDTNAPNTLEIHGYIGDGVVTLTDALADNLITSLISPDPLASAFIGFDVTSFFSGPVNYSGFMIRMQDETLDHAQGFDDNYIPILNVVSVSEPSTALLLFAGMIGLAAFRRKPI